MFSLRAAVETVTQVKEGVWLGAGGGLSQMAKRGPVFMKEYEKHLTYLNLKAQSEKEVENTHQILGDHSKMKARHLIRLLI